MATTIMIYHCLECVSASLFAANNQSIPNNLIIRTVWKERGCVSVCQSDNTPVCVHPLSLSGMSPLTVHFCPSSVSGCSDGWPEPERRTACRVTDHGLSGVRTTGGGTQYITVS